MHVPGIRPQPVPHLCLGAGADNQHGAALVGQGTAEHDEVLLNQVVDEGRMLVPVRLLARALRMVAFRAGGRRHDERRSHALMLHSLQGRPTRRRSVSRRPLLHRRCET